MVLNDALFHGTTVPLRPGKDKVLPAVKHGQGSVWNDMGADAGQPSRNHAFATASEKEAWYFAQHTAATYGHSDRARVYEVGPNRLMKPGVHTALKEYIAPSFPVRRAIDIKPGAQGTLTGDGPEPYNWNLHRTPGAYGDANHPEPPDPVPAASRNAQSGLGQANVHKAWARRSGPDARLQPALFDMAHVDEESSDSIRARRHDTRHLVNTGEAPAPVFDPVQNERDWSHSLKMAAARRMNERANLRWGGR